MPADKPKCSATQHHFAADGEERFLGALKLDVYNNIQRKVDEEFSARLAQAGWISRLRIRWLMRREIRRRLAAEMPSEYTLW